MMTSAMLTGKSDQHLVALDGRHRLQPEAVTAFLALQLAAKTAGFNLQPASTFRDFERQRQIWNGKFRGERPIMDANSQPLDVSSLDEGDRCEAILRWSAMPAQPSPLGQRSRYLRSRFITRRQLAPVGAVGI